MWRFINYINAKYDYNVTKNKYYRRKIKINIVYPLIFTLLMLKGKSIK